MPVFVNRYKGFYYNEVFQKFYFIFAVPA